MTDFNDLLVHEGNSPKLALIRHHEGMSFAVWSRFAAVKYWQGIPAFDPPSRRRDYEGMADMAERMLATRQRWLSDMAPDDLARITAADEVALFETLAAHWGAICNRCEWPDRAMDEAVLRDALDAALKTIAAKAAQTGDLSGALADQAELVIALRWWAEPALRLRPRPKPEIATPPTSGITEGELA